MKRFDAVRVFLTGHTGFKGAWTIAVLRALGARVAGYALAPPTQPSLFDEGGLASEVDHRNGDIRDLASLRSAMRAAKPDLVMHLAAQSLVVTGYADPLETYSTNVIGTANVVEAMRELDSVRAAVIVTSDKCYRPAPHALREDDPLGGDEPYSASKACAEIVVEGYRPLLDAGRTVVATVRAGNVIGGGDWSRYRLVADLARAMLADRNIVLRHPHAIRPWQHVFDAIGGYLLVARRALDADASVARAWNFGPLDDEHLEVAQVVERFARAYGSELELTVEASSLPENPALRLDSSRAQAELGWAPVLRVGEAIELSAQWYRGRAEGRHPGQLLSEQVAALLQRSGA